MSLNKTGIAFFLLIFTVSMFPAPPGSKPPQMISKEQLLKTGEEWRDIYDEYEVDESLLETLNSKVDGALKIVVYLGTWCGDSRNNVPQFLKIIDTLDVQPEVKYYDVERKPNPEVKYYVKELEVERVPTFIFYRKDKEIGRIIENPKNSLIEDFIEIVF